MISADNKYLGALVVALVAAASALILALGICTRIVDRTHYEDALEAARVGSNIGTVRESLERAGCLRLSSDQGFVSYECLPRSDCACRFVPVLVDVVNIRYSEDLVVRVEVYDAVSWIPKPRLGLECSDSSRPR